jgi:rod shape-determining protein MreD
VFALLQLSVAPHIAILGVQPDLALLLVTSWGLLSGARWGALWGVAIGVLLDVISGLPVGTLTVGLALAGLLSGAVEGQLFRTYFLLPLIVTAVGTLIYYGCSLGIMTALDWQVNWGESFSRLVLPALAYNVVLSPLVFTPVRWVHRLTQREQMEW